MDTYENNEVIPQSEKPEPVSEPVPEPAAEPIEEPVAEPVAPQPDLYQSSQHEYENTDILPDPEAPVPQPKKKRTGKVWKPLLSLLLVAALVATGCCATAFVMNQYWSGKMNAQMQEMKDTIKELEEFVNDNSFTGNGNSVSGTPNGTPDGSLTPGQVYAKCQKSVVAISCLITTNNFGQTTTGNSTGSGFLISENGYLVTNYHVVEGASQISVTIYNGTEYAATLVGQDANNDMAVLKIEEVGLPAATIGSSDDLIVGDQVVAIGNPLGKLTNSLTVGYISAKDRNVSTDGASINMLQTDAAINSGNSGGPLFNMKGEVIGITSAKYSGTTSSGAVIEGVGFAIPMDDVIRKINDLVNHGFITGAYLGIYVRDMDPSLSAYGIPIGAYVEEASEGYCAHKAGVQSKDIIIKLGQYDIGSLSDLTRALDKFKGGETTTITVWRSGTQIELEITLDEKPH